MQLEDAAKLIPEDASGVYVITSSEELDAFLKLFPEKVVRFISAGSFPRVPNRSLNESAVLATCGCLVRMQEASALTLIGSQQTLPVCVQYGHLYSTMVYHVQYWSYEFTGGTTLWVELVPPMQVLNTTS